MLRKTSKINVLLTASASLSVLLVAIIGTLYTSALQEGIATARDALTSFLEWYYVALVAFLFFFIA